LFELSWLQTNTQRQKDNLLGGSYVNGYYILCNNIYCHSYTEVVQILVVVLALKLITITVLTVLFLVRKAQFSFGYG